MPTASVILRRLAVAALAFHGAAMCLGALVPGAVTRSLAPWLSPYLQVTGSLQSWDMFRTIPYYHDCVPWLRAVDVDGIEHRFGPIVPGLEPADRSARSVKLFANLLGNYGKRYVGPYLEHARRAIRDQRGLELRSLELVVELERIRNLRDIRRTGSIATHQRRSAGKLEWESP